ncbi:MAG: GLPGLI family protein [Polaribacter sp.]|jgi:GLPGLI family protein
MKNCFLILLLIISLHGFSQKINGRVTYIVSVEPLSEKKIDSITKSSKLKNLKMNSWMKSVLKNTPDVNAFLEFNIQESIYYVEDKMQNDGESRYNMNRTYAGGDNKYYKNSNTKEFYNESDVFGELSLINLPKKKWKITQESKVIGGYVCYKAIDLSYKNNSTFAWFTPQIPVSFGPKNFAGLPGLILEIQLKRRKIIATKIVLNPKNKIIINKPTKGKRVTVEEAKKRYSSFWKSIQKQ